MKRIKLYEEFVNEKITPATSTFNGKQLKSEWAGSADNEKDFIKMIKNMPETLQSIKVTSSANSFNPTAEEFKGPMTAQVKSKIIKIVKDVTKQFKDVGDEVTSYELNSYFGVSSPEHHNQDPAYIQYRTRKLDRFAKDMGSGKYGPLD